MHRRIDPEANKAVIRRFFEEMWNERNPRIVDEVAAPTYVLHIPGRPDVHGPEGNRQLYALFLSAFPDFHYEVEGLIAEGALVAARWIFSGTHEGEFLGIPPTGSPVTVAGFSWLRMEDGKVAEVWVLQDTLGMLQQMGAIPAPEAPGITWMRAP